MILQGTLLNSGLIIVGALLGLALQKRISTHISSAIKISIAVCILVIGLQMSLKFKNVFVMLGCVGLGGAIGTFLQLEKRIEDFARRIARILRLGGESRFAEGFSISSILFCTGAMAVVGSINSGVANDHQVLFAKAVIDGFTSITLAAIYGVGVGASAISVLLYQGALTLAAFSTGGLFSPAALDDISGVGGVLVVMIAIRLMEIKEIRVGDFLPAILLVLLATALRI